MIVMLNYAVQLRILELRNRVYNNIYKHIEKCSKAIDDKI